ncbi:aminoacyl-tRNA hydrolase [Gemmatimonas sp.]|uniref:aminoacyl-tRNA hydrolase n=1 Tax=Gemmatimonas sp. TaxID=1962908 RepID=UPI0039830ED1
MKVIVGLGNPGREYEHTRHNVGWWLVDHLARHWHFDPWRKDGDAVTTQGLVGGKKIKLVKPQTFMNLSGAALRPYLKREGWTAADDLMVIVDEVAVPAGEYRLRAAGSPGGHNGLKSIEAHLKSPTYPRLRIGIKPVDDRRPIGDLADFVLHTMPRDERELVEALYSRMVTALELWIADGTEKAVSTMGR